MVLLYNYFISVLLFYFYFILKHYFVVVSKAPLIETLNIHILLCSSATVYQPDRFLWANRCLFFSSSFPHFSVFFIPRSRLRRRAVSFRAHVNTSYRTSVLCYRIVNNCNQQFIDLLQPKAELVQ